MHVFVITLVTHPKRLAAFYERANELNISGFHLIQGVDGNVIGKPNWWKPNARRWACNMAHLNALHTGMMWNATQGKSKPILILEDDCYLRDNFRRLWHEAVEYYKMPHQASILFLGGRDHDSGHQVSDHIFMNVRVGGGYAYSCSPEYAKEMSAYFMNRPLGKKTARHYAQDTKMQKRGISDGHATMRPFMVGHNGGPSVINKGKVRRSRDAPSAKPS